VWLIRVEKTLLLQRLNPDGLFGVGQAQRPDLLRQDLLDFVQHASPLDNLDSAPFSSGSKLRGGIWEGVTTAGELAIAHADQRDR
jgi:hypothetical protein